MNKPDIKYNGNLTTEDIRFNEALYALIEEFYPQKNYPECETVVMKLGSVIQVMVFLEGEDQYDAETCSMRMEYEEPEKGTEH